MIYFLCWFCLGVVHAVSRADKENTAGKTRLLKSRTDYASRHKSYNSCILYVCVIVRLTFLL